MMLMLGLAVGLALLGILRLHLRRALTTNTEQTSQVHSPSLCRAVISGTLIHKNQHNHLSPWEARAIPNRRLQIAFGIDNAFTSADKMDVQAFKNVTVTRMNLSSEKWGVAAHFVSDVVKNLLEHGLDDGEAYANDAGSEAHSAATRIDLCALVQALSLKVVRLIMFDRGEDDTVSDCDLLRLARAINRVWIASKQQAKHDGPNQHLDAVPRFGDDHELQSSLAAVFGTHHQAKDNPLNLLLPSFETLWRVVLRAFIETRFTTGQNEPQWQDALIAFAECPTKHQFERRLTGPSFGSTDKSKTESHDERRISSTCAKDLVMESLRLYTPTRRIHRAYSWKDNSSSPNISESSTTTSESSSFQTLAADIEACHLDLKIWGSEAQLFRPHRWENITKGQKEAFMPFGCPPFECPAKGCFGPRMIGLLVGALLAGLDERLEWRLESVDAKTIHDLQSGLRLDANRDAYGDLELIGYLVKRTSDAHTT